MLQLSFYPGLPDGLDLQAKVKRDVLQSVVISSQNGSVFQGFGQNLQVRWRKNIDVACLRSCHLRFS
jgi:hypothetical protein